MSSHVKAKEACQEDGCRGIVKKASLRLNTEKMEAEEGMEGCPVWIRNHREAVNNCLGGFLFSFSFCCLFVC